MQSQCSKICLSSFYWYIEKSYFMLKYFLTEVAAQGVLKRLITHRYPTLCDDIFALCVYLFAFILPHSFIFLPIKYSLCFQRKQVEILSNCYKGAHQKLEQSEHILGCSACWYSTPTFTLKADTFYTRLFILYCPICSTLQLLEKLLRYFQKTAVHFNY